MTCREVKDLLDARLDNELDVASMAGVDRHLAECRACSAQYAALQSLHRDIAAADLSYAPPPALERKLAARFLESHASRSVWSQSWRGFFALVGAAACLLLIVSLSVVRGGRQTEAIAAEVLDSHLRALQPNHLVDVPSSDQHTVKPWFQGKTSFSPPVRDLASQGFPLVGGRLDVIRQQPVAALVYRRRQHVISLYVTPSAATDAKPASLNLSGYHLLYWTQNGMGYWAVSDVDPADLRVFGELMR
ncbi:MAG: anti-sigma factor [Acidobacteriia bacterium]|nr:anti-sigma factor [Terriglobia bacterium]